MAKSPAAILYDSSGNEVGVELDGAIYRLQGANKLARASDGAFVNPATEETLATIDAVLDSIKDTEGVKKITDPLPAGTNEIGAVAQGTKAAGAGAWPQVLYDATGNPVGVVLDGAVYRLQTASKIARASDGAYINPTTEETQVEVRERLSNLIDPNNSSTAQLGAGASFAPSPGTDVSGYAAVAVTVHSDQDSALNGMRFEFSINGTDWDDSYAFNLVAASSSTRRFQFPVCAQWFRVNYTNGATPTTEFRVQTLLHRDNILTSIHRVENVVKEDRSAQLTKATIIAQREGASVQDFYPVQADVQGNLKVTTIGSDIPSDPGAFVLEYCVDGGGAHLMLVDGSVTPVIFQRGPVAGEVWSIRELLLTFTADDFAFDGVSFGSLSALTNGVSVRIVKDAISTEVFTVVQNEDFLRVPGRTPLVNNTGPKDVLGAALAFQGLILEGDTGDTVQVWIRDNLTSIKLKFFAATLFAVKVT